MLHAFRHTAATWLMQAGVPVWTAAGHLGVSVEVALNPHGHHHPAICAKSTQLPTVCTIMGSIGSRLWRS
jgi:hypothetical protein